MKKINITDKNKNRIIWLVGFVVVFTLIYSKMVIGEYKISFTNLMYSVSPWTTENVNVSGPNLSDVSDSSYPKIYQQIISDDDFSFWNKYTALGYESDIRQYVYPLNIVFIMPLDIAIFLKYFIEFFLAFYGMYLLLKLYKCSKFPAAIGGIIYMCSSVMVVWLGWPHSDVVALAPLAFYFTEKLIQHIRLSYAMCLTAVIFTMIFAGMPTYVAYFVYLLVAYSIIFTIKKNKKDIISTVKTAGLFVLSYILAVLMSIPYTITLINSVVGNGYASSRSSQGTQILPLDYIRTIFFPYIRDNLPSHINESTVYIGLLAIILIPFSFYRIKNKKRVIFFGITSIITFLLIFTHSLDFIYTLIPAINTSLKIRVIALFNFSTIIFCVLNLNDIYINFDSYKKKKILLGVDVLLMLSFLIYEIDSMGAEVVAHNEEKIIIVASILLLLLVAIIGYIYCKKKVIFTTMIFILVCVDMCRFASAYLPWIDKNADIIPKATDSIKYLQENTEEENRITGLGMWNLYPNTNVYYGLSDLRGHNFIYTNKDIHELYLKIDDTCYTTPTRVIFNKIDNYNLLRYLGVKNIFAENLLFEVKYGDIQSNKEIVGLFESDMIIEQDFVATEDNLDGIRLLFATYGVNPSSSEKMQIDIIEKETNEIIASDWIKFSELRDNSYRGILFDKILNSKGKKFKIKVIIPKKVFDSVTLWKTTDSNEEKLYVNKVEQTGHIIMSACYDKNSDFNIVYNGNDGLQIGELNEFSNKAELISNVYYCKDDKEVLTNMMNSYSSSNMYVVDSGKEDVEIPLDSDEFAKVVNYSGDNIEIKYSSDTERYILVNDYFDSNWHAYIGDKEITIDKANYLLRAIKVPAGKDVTVIMKYEQNYFMYYIAGITMIVYLVLILVCVMKRRRRRYHKYTGEDHTFAISAYKDSPYLEKCIESLKKQTEESNIIIGTSTPSKFIENIAEKYNISLFVRDGKSNIAEDWNFAYDSCKTKLVTIAHQDDIYKEDYLKNALEMINKSRDPVIYFNNYNEIKNEIEVKKNKLLSIKRIMLIPLIPRIFHRSKWIRRRVLSFGCPILCPSVMYVRDKMPHPLFESKMRASLDWEQWEILSKIDGEFVYSSRVLTCHRIHPGSETSAAINDSDRTKEDFEMYMKFWPRFVAKLLMKFYSKSQESNNEVS